MVYSFVDIETNGGTGERGRCIEVAAIKVVDGAIVDTFTSLINPGMSVPSWITRLTGITNSELVDAPYFSDIADDLYRFLDSSVFVAHNVLFDYSFLRNEFAASGYNFRPKLFCTVKMSRALWPEHRGHSLEAIIKRHSIATADRHRAYDDARVMYEYVMHTLRYKGAEALSANLALQLKTKSLPPNVSEQTILDLPETYGIYIFEDDKGQPLYVGKSVNIRARVRSHFTRATSVAKEMKMSLQSHNVSFITTETELEALLLESATVKQLQPLFNRRLRRAKSQHCIIKHDDSDYATFSIESRNLGQYTNLDQVYGVFSSRHQAKKELDSIGRTYQLCPMLLGLEKSTGACFRYQLGLCRGACIGKESPKSYNSRVELALERIKLESWPYASKIAIALSSVRTLIIDQWIPQGVYDQQDDSYHEIGGAFDLDTYKILRSFLRTHRQDIRLLPPGSIYST